MFRSLVSEASLSIKKNNVDTQFIYWVEFIGIEEGSGRAFIFPR